MELTVEEKIMIEENRVRSVLQEKPDGLSETELVEEYKNRYKSDLKSFEEEFTSLGAFLKYRVKATINNNGGEKYCLSATASASQSAVVQPVHMVSRPQFSQFFGFGEVDKSKGVAYRVWRFEVNSAILGGLYTNQVIAEQIRRSLQGEAKSKLVGLGPDADPKTILEKLDQFYSDVGAATGDEILSEAYQFRQRENEEVAAFASRLDNHVRIAKSRGTEILPDEDAVERQLRMLFWQGISEPIKDKARHKKDQCKSFAELITAARYGEKEITPTQAHKRVARSNQITKPDISEKQPTCNQTDANVEPAWVKEVCSLARDVRELVKDQKSTRPQGKRDSARGPVTCYRCGQQGHIQVGCRNPAKPDNKPPGNDRGPLLRGKQGS